MNNFDIEIPGELITSNDSEINFDLLKNKTVLGLCGYARSGKDTIGNMMVDKLSFKRISFGDVLKKDLDEHMKVQVFEDLRKKGVEISMEDVSFLSPKTIENKELLRPYMIWFGETMKIRNGIHHWTNRALLDIGESKKVVITDVRRVNELELFKYNKEQQRKKIDNIIVAEMPIENLTFAKDNQSTPEFDSLLIHINQFRLIDGDQKTIDTIRMAHENWLFDYTVYVDSRIPDKEGYRNTYMYNNLLKLIDKYPKYFI